MAAVNDSELIRSESENRFVFRVARAQENDR
jgi:hypothetical protein